MRLATILSFVLFSFFAVGEDSFESIVLKSKIRPLRIVNMEYQVDKSGLGRAWVSLDVVYNDFDSYIYESVKTRVAGLSHDLEYSEVLFNDIVCAQTKKVQQRRFLRKPIEVIKVSPTGNCHIHATFSKKLVTIDEGFDVTREYRYVVDLEVSSSANK